MAHGVSRHRESRPHQAQRVYGERRRQVLTYARKVEVAFADGNATRRDVAHVTQWAENEESRRSARLTGQV